MACTRSIVPPFILRSAPRWAGYAGQHRITRDCIG